MDRFKDLWNYDVIFVNELVDRSVLVGGKSLWWIWIKSMGGWIEILLGSLSSVFVEDLRDLEDLKSFEVEEGELKICRWRFDEKRTASVWKNLLELEISGVEDAWIQLEGSWSLNWISSVASTMKVWRNERQRKSSIWGIVALAVYLLISRESFDSKFRNKTFKLLLWVS
jgi:hypothetical protein